MEGHVEDVGRDPMSDVSDRVDDSWAPISNGHAAQRNGRFTIRCTIVNWRAGAAGLTLDILLGCGMWDDRKARLRNE